jgi:hypothetical protein
MLLQLIKESQMTTLIAKENTNGTVTVSVVSESSFPQPIQQTLFEHYSNERKVEKLFRLGMLDFIAPNIGEEHSVENAKEVHPDWCSSYLRDGNDARATSRQFDNVGELVAFALSFDYEQVYLFGKGKWYAMEVAKIAQVSFEPLTRVA